MVVVLGDVDFVGGFPSPLLLAIAAAITITANTVAATSGRRNDGTIPRSPVVDLVACNVIVKDMGSFSASKIVVAQEERECALLSHRRSLSLQPTVRLDARFHEDPQYA